jgi:hypothetical protein
VLRLNCIHGVSVSSAVNVLALFAGAIFPFFSAIAYAGNATVKLASVTMRHNNNHVVQCGCLAARSSRRQAPFVGAWQNTVFAELCSARRGELSQIDICTIDRIREAAADHPGKLADKLKRAIGPPYSSVSTLFTVTGSALLGIQ